MKVTININGVDTEILLTPEQYNQAVAQTTKKKFEWEYNDDACILLADTIDPTGNGKAKSFLEHGRYRLTREVAEQSLLRNKRANRLEALAEQLGGLKEFVVSACNWHIYQNAQTNLWGYSDNMIIWHPTHIYMTPECAKEICRMLNEGEFSLDEEL